MALNGIIPETGTLPTGDELALVVVGPQQLGALQPVEELRLAQVDGLAAVGHGCLSGRGRALERALGRGGGRGVRLHRAVGRMIPSNGVKIGVPTAILGSA